MPSAVTEQDRIHIARALELAERGRGSVSPNPLVGAVLVRDEQVIGEGWHAELGGLHAERSALADCAERGHEPRGSTAYVTLEPCAHQGRQPPCADALVEAGVSRVVYAADDPSEHASGHGPQRLRDAGIEVVQAEGSEAEASRLQNQAFRKHARTGMPLVIVKRAMSLDGQTATEEGDSKWISGADSRELVHRWRAEADAVAVGIGTVLADDPLLTARTGGELARSQPLRVVFDGHARLPPEAMLLSSLDVAGLIVVVLPDAPGGRVERLRQGGADVLHLDAEDYGDSQGEKALRALGARGVTSILVEGGSGLAASFRQSMDELRLFIAPIVLGGNEFSVLGETGVKTIADGARPLALEQERVGDDILIRARMREW